MSRDETHGGGEWGFGKCLWSPSHKRGDRKRSWLFWKNLLDVQQGDVIIHLRGKGRLAAFVGYSIAATDGHETLEHPPKAGKWNYATSYFRVLLKDFQEFKAPIKLDTVFSKYRGQLIMYLEGLSNTPTNRFFVYQSGRLQCLNGAYLSKCDEELLSFILNKQAGSNDTLSPSPPSMSSTAEIWGKVRQRIGQRAFAEAVKKNYHFKCCFPSCNIDDPQFLIGSHIARWVDNPDMRGQTSNGLCLCVLHDKAFENGYFSLDDDLRVVISKNPEIQKSTVFSEYIRPFNNYKIKCAEITPNKEALKEHRFRCNISDD